MEHDRRPGRGAARDRGRPAREPRPGRRAGGWRPASIVALAVAIAVGLTLVVGTAVSVLLFGTGLDTTTVLLPAAGVTSLLVGTILVQRLPGHRIGWLLWTTGLFIGATVIGPGFASLGFSHPGSVPAPIAFAWIGSWAGGPALFAPGILLPLLYPTGEPPSPRWRFVAPMTIVALAAWCVVMALTPFAPGTYATDPRNPVAPGGSAGAIVASLPNALNATLLVLLAIALISLIVRYRRARGAEREQLKWFAYIGAMSLSAISVAGLALGQTSGVLATVDNVAWFVGIGGIALLPLAIGIAVLRYRLYEIDRLVSRTISYGLLTVILGGLFVGAVVLLQALLVPVTRRNDVAVAGSTLLIVSLFQPLRRRLQRLVDHRFNRGRYDADVALAAFGARVRGEVDLDAVRGATMAAAVSTLEPASISTWLRS